eukprot:803926-Amphidinium_carterae.1
MSPRREKTWNLQSGITHQFKYYCTHRLFVPLLAKAGCKQYGQDMVMQALRSALLSSHSALRSPRPARTPKIHKN